MSILDHVGANKNGFIVYKLSLMFNMIGLESQTNLELTPSLKKNNSDCNNGLLVLSIMLPNVGPLSVWLLGFCISMLTPCIRG